MKRLKRRGSRVELISENPHYAPMVWIVTLPTESLEVGLIRGDRALKSAPVACSARAPIE